VGCSDGPEAEHANAPAKAPTMYGFVRIYRADAAKHARVAQKTPQIGV
jgi:hypothetical protein